MLGGGGVDGQEKMKYLLTLVNVSKIVIHYVTRKAIITLNAFSKFSHHF